VKTAVKKPRIDRRAHRGLGASRRLASWPAHRLFGGFRRSP
jgi:hypothetical protein